MSRLLEEYKKTIIEDLKSKLSVSNIHQVPKISKIVINMGIGDAKDDTKLIDKAQEELSLISGQKAIKTKAIIVTLFPPILSAIAPNIGANIPHMSFCIPIAKPN